MKSEFTAVVERDDPWYVAYCPEIPGANGQGQTKAECLENLKAAIEPFFAIGAKTDSRAFRATRIERSASSYEPSRASAPPPTARLRV
jgi:predicted RNase H-like HicB family nuclease